MNTEITPLLAWLRQATKEQQERVATLAGTSSNYLYQLASPGGKRGKRISADSAFRIEDATTLLKREDPTAPEPVNARDLAAMWAVIGL